MLDKIVQSRVVCQSVCLDINCIEIMWCVAVFTLLIPVMDACVWVLDNLKRCTHLSVIKCDWESLSNNALHVTYWPALFWISTLAVARKMWFLGMPLNEQYVLTSAVGLTWEPADWLFIEFLSVADWVYVARWNKVWCLLRQCRHTCSEQVRFLMEGCKQLKQIRDCLT